MSRMSHHELAGEEHEHDDFDSFVLGVSAPDRSTAEARVRAAMAIDGVLRIKGLVAIDGRAAPLAVQAVGPRVETWFVPEEARKPGLGGDRATRPRSRGGGTGARGRWLKSPSLRLSSRKARSACPAPMRT